MIRVLFLAPLFFCGFAYAKPVIVKQMGKPATATWPSGNQAELQVQRLAPIVPTVEFRVSENSCRSDMGQAIKMHFPTQASLLLWIWTKHSDPKKVGSVLKKGGDSLADVFIYTNGSGFRFPDLTKELSKDRMEPTDLSFIPGLEGPYRPFTIDIWMTENMVQNPETGVMENRIRFTGSGVHFAEDGSISIDSPSESGAGGNPLAMIGDVVTWLVDTPSKGLCQISFKPDLGPAQAEIGKYLTSFKGPFVPYIWNSDDISTLLRESQKSPLTDNFVEAADE